jgi:catechol 2,3-dioxygenase-like lactoylglutathione lyase family enzyme
MEPRLSLVTLGVADLERATHFYRDVLQLPRLPSPPEISFFDLGKTRLALFPRDLLARDAGVPAAGTGFRAFTLSHNVASEAQVHRLFDELAAAGAKIVKPPRRADWGGVSGYFADPDGFLWEVAWNPDLLPD